jgi:hypothetical protein
MAEAQPKAIPSDAKRCAGTRKDGAPCGALALGPSGYCYTHDPERTEQRAEARRRGGRNSAKVVRLRGFLPSRLVPVYEALEAALSEVHDGELDARRANAMASLARAMATVLTAGELEERVRTLEERANR